VGRLALAVTVICGARLLDQDATTGRLTMRSSTIYELISSVMRLARWTAYASFWSMIASVPSSILRADTTQDPGRTTPRFAFNGCLTFESQFERSSRKSDAMA
jgi:hypothetical protein